MDFSVKQAGLEDIGEKVASGQRISDADALRLYRSRDIHAVGAIANVVRERKNAHRATFIHNRYINYSNICYLSCGFCAFARKIRDEGAFEYSVEEIVALAREAVKHGVTEIHIVGGLHPTLPFRYYTDMLRALKALSPQLHLKAFTAIEILHLAWRGKMTMPQTLETLREAGLGSLTGGGAEIFNPEVRKTICRGKESPEEWLEVHRTWHRMGQRSTATMLYGHIETLEDRVDHLRRLRELQDETGGFLSFVPYAYEPEHAPMAKKHPIARTSAVEDLLNIAVARTYLDNFDHITAYWIAHGPQLAQIALSYGADDVHGTIIEEKIFHMAGAKTPQTMSRAQLIAAIREAGREPCQRNSLFEIIDRAPTEIPQQRAAPPPISVPRNPARLATVPYLNAKPLIWGLEDRLAYVEPSAMAQRLRAGEFDGGLVPIVECLGAADYEIVDDVAVASNGPVQSVLLAHQTPMAQLKEVAVDPASSTSVALLRIILRERYGIEPKFTVLEDETRARACLLIGDRALKFLWSHPQHPTLDLAREWNEWTGLPFVFAVWALRRGGPDSNAVAAMLRRAKEQGLAHLEQIIAQHPADQRDFLRAYFTRSLSYHLGDPERRAIAKFQEYLGTKKELRYV